MTTRWARFDRPLDASPGRVYRAWSAPEELATWFAPAVDGSLAVDTRSFLVWSHRRIWIDVVEAEPERVFRFRWPMMSDDDPRWTEVTVTIEPLGYGTKLTLQDGTFDLERGDELEAWSQAVEGWATALANLRAQVDFAVDLRPRP